MGKNRVMRKKRNSKIISILIATLMAVAQIAIPVRGEEVLQDCESITDELITAGVASLYSSDDDLFSSDNSDTLLNSSEDVLVMDEVVELLGDEVVLDDSNNSVLLESNSIVELNSEALNSSDNNSIYNSIKIIDEQDYYETNEVEVYASSESVIENAIKWGQSQLGSTSYNGKCQAFVFRCYNAAGLSIGSYETAKACRNALMKNTNIDAPRGALVFFDKIPEDIYGHVGISLGNGVMLHAGHNGVEETKFTDDSYLKTWYKIAYRGWGMPSGISSSSSPNGNIDSIGTSDGKLYVGGWALDPDSPETSIQVNVYVEGRTNPIASFKTHIKRDIAGGQNCGFDETIDISGLGLSGKKEVSLWGIDVTGDENAEIGSEVIDFNDIPCDCEMTRGVDKIKNGEYVLVSEKSLDDSGKIRKDNPYVIDIDNRDVVIERKLSSDSPIWEIELIENRFYNIYNRKTDKAMSLEEDSKKRLTNIHVGKYKESDHTAWWSFDEMWPGKFIIENRYSEMCATICSGDSIKQKEFLGKSDCETQTWLLVRPDKPTIKTTTIPNGEIGKEYATSLVGECDEWIAIEWSLANDSGALPEGLSLSKDGVISGTPTKAGDYAIKINATNEFGTTTQSYILSITGPAVVPVTSVSLSKTSLEMNEGGSVTLTASVTPGDATDKTLTWKSSNEKVVTVSTSGKVTAIKAGTATITATSVSNSNKSASCTVKVNPLIVAVNSVNLDKTTISMNEGDTATLKATIAPDNASNKSVTWKSSDEKVATVSSTGKVTAVKEGTATITATSNSNKDKSASCKVTVKTKPSGILIKADDVIVMVGKTVSVPVRISGNTGLGGIALTVTNDSGLVLEKIEKGSLLSTGTFNTDTNSGMIQWYTSNAAVKGDGILFTLHFKIKDGTVPGDYAVKIGLKDGNKANVTDENSKVLDVAFGQGKVSVNKRLKGDVTGDGEIAMGDVVKVARGVAGTITLTSEEKEAADVTGDNDVAMGDVVKIARYVAGTINEL